MKKVILLLITIFLISCNFSQRVKKTTGNQFVKVEYSQVIITDFDWGISRTGINEVDGDFETLNNEIFKSLKGKNGIYSILLIYNNVPDRFGNKTTNSYIYGSIDATKLSQYVDASYWVNDTGGMEYIFTHAEQGKIGLIEFITCNKCKGVGKQECTSCNGTGKKTFSGTSTEAECPICSGSGLNLKYDDLYGKSEIEKCYKCGGTGKIIESNNIPVTITCPSCNGSGYSDSVCNRCNGSGTIEKSPNR